MNIKRFITIAMFSFLFIRAYGYEERNLLAQHIDTAAIGKHLLTDRSGIPYPAYSDRQAWSELAGEQGEAIIKTGEKYLGHSWKAPRLSDYLLFDSCGNRNAMEKPYNEDNNAFASLLAAELVEGSGRFIKDIADGVFHYCELTSWAISAHIAKFSKTGSAMPLEGDCTLELTQGNVAQMLSWAHYFLAKELDRINPEIDRRLKSELYRRELNPYLERDDYWWMGLKIDLNKDFLNNWTPWCTSNALICFMLVEDNPHRIEAAVKKSIKSLDRYLNFIHNDGGIEEGPTYWNHSAGKLFDCLNVLGIMTGGWISASGIQLFRDMGEFLVNSYIGNGWIVNFSDASAKTSFHNLPTVFNFGKAVGSVPMQDFAARHAAEHKQQLKATPEFFRFLEGLRTNACLMSYSPSGTASSNISIRYPDTGFYFEKHGEELFFAGSDSNNARSHNHNDIGSFILYLHGEPVIIDAGVGTYTKDTFSNRRYTIWTMQSAYHNLPIINGCMQKAGKKYAAKEVVAGKGRYAMDIAGAYPEEAAVQKWKRSYRIAESGLKILDEFHLEKVSEPSKIVFMTCRDAEIAADGRIDLGNAVLEYAPEDFTATIETIDIDDAQLVRVWGQKLHRIVLEAKECKLKGKYSYRITDK